jgi:addiction module RelE/StbE family toxin
MIIKFHKNFRRKFKKLTPKLKDKTNNAIKIFKQNPHEPILQNHPLRGKMLNQRAFSVSGSIRIVFEERGDYIIVLFLDIGNHPQVYK